MAVVPSLPTLANAGTALLVAALGVYILRLRPRRSGNVDFGALAVAYGLAMVFDNLSGALFTVGDPMWSSTRVLTGVLLVGAAVAALRMALTFPSPPGAEGRRPLLLVLSGALVLVFLPALFFPDFPENPAERVRVTGTRLYIGAVLGYVAFLALRFRHPSATPAERRQHALLAVAFSLWPGFVAGTWLTTSATQALPGGIVTFAALVGASALWLRGTTLPEARHARITTLALLAPPLLGGISALALGTPEARSTNPGYAVTRIAGIAIVGYAVLQHQLLGLDVKVRWTLQRSAVAAIFVAVFFVASESAQQFFGDALGSEYVGILAAGVLLFAIAPLQRLAGRLAHAAVPAAAGPVDDDRRRRVFRDAVRYALRDGRLTRAEERHLADLAAELAIDPSAALTLREEVEASLAGAPPPGGPATL